MTIKYSTNHDLEIHITNAAEAVGIPMGALSVNHFRDPKTGEVTTSTDRTGSVFIVGDGETDSIVMIHMQFDNYFMPLDVIDKNLVHRKIFRSTVRQLFKKLISPPLQKFLIALYDDLLPMGWEVAVSTETETKVPMVQWIHRESKVGMLPIPNSRTELSQTIEAAKAGQLDGSYDEVIKEMRSNS
jgi:hypothetical protein